MVLLRQAVRFLIGLGVCALVVAGCGSDDGGDAAQPAPVAESTADDVAPTEEPDADTDTDADAEEPDESDQDTNEDWAPIIDESSGVRFALPGEVEPLENTATVEDGSEVALRNYAAVSGEGIEVGFNVIDTDGARYDLEAGVDGVAATLGGDVVSSDEVEVNGHAAREVEMTYGEDKFVLFQLIRTDEHVMQSLASGPTSDREAVEEAYRQLLDSLEVY